MNTALDTQPTTKAKSRRVNSLGKLLAAHNEILGAWLISGLPGDLEIRRNGSQDFYSIAFCGHDPIGFVSMTIYQGDRDFELKKQRILDYLSGKIDYLKKEGEIL